MESKRYHITVAGRVQGVGYRYFARDVAQSLGLSGWVRNLRGGDVELEVEGAQEDVDRLVEKLREGPPLSRVTDVGISPMVAVGAASEFYIRR
ncbi:MAG: acylphosphatase [Chitinispirillia bacterium]|nr:acylphosphatase [Chitinispirillia bacterium]MCL2241429.1 acylphosphatase [Chitinispirillia bacterium]